MRYPKDFHLVPTKALKFWFLFNVRLHLGGVSSVIDIIQWQIHTNTNFNRNVFSSWLFHKVDLLADKGFNSTLYISFNNMVRVIKAPREPTSGARSSLRWFPKFESKFPCRYLSRASKLFLGPALTVQDSLSIFTSFFVQVMKLKFPLYKNSRLSSVYNFP